MNYNFQNVVAEISTKRSREEKWTKALFVLAFVAAICTVLALISPASAMESTNGTDMGTVITESDAEKETVAETEETPAKTEEIPAETEETPVETEEIPAETEEIPVETEETPVETEEISEFLEAPMLAFPLLSAEKKDSEGSGIVVSKTNVYDSATDQYVISLEAYANGTELHGRIPNDMVLVLDKSGSMEYTITIREESQIKGNMYVSGTDAVLKNLDKTLGATSGYYQLHIINRGGWGDYYAPLRYRNGKWQWLPNGRIFYRDMDEKPNVGNFGEVIIPGKEETVEKMDLLKKSVIEFLDKIEADSQETGVTHKVSIVTFDTTAHEAFYTVVNGGRRTQVPYGFLSLSGNKETDDYKTIVNIVNGINPNGGTDHGYAMEEAERVVNAQEKLRPNSNKSVILFTDGEPDGDRYNNTIRSEALKHAYNLKSKGVKVYTVGLFDRDSDNTAKSLVEYISSDYPKAVSMDNTWTKENSGYSFAQTSGETLQYNFGEIADKIITDSEVIVDNHVYLKDIVTEYFTVNDVYAYCDESGVLTKTDITITKTPKETETDVIVGSFDITEYNESKKLVVKIYTKAKDGYIFSKDEVYSNDAESGLYKSETDVMIEPFVNPTVDLYDFTVKYLLSGTDEPLFNPMSGFLFRGKTLKVSATDKEKYVKPVSDTDIVTESHNEVIFYYTPELSDTNITYSSTNYGKVRLSGTDVTNDYVTETDKIGSPTAGAFAVPDDGCRFVNWTDENGEELTTTDYFNPGSFVQDIKYIANFVPDVFGVTVKNTIEHSEVNSGTDFEIVIENAKFTSTDFLSATSIPEEANLTGPEYTEDGKVKYTFKLNNNSEAKFIVPNGCNVTVSEVQHDGYYVSYKINDTSAVEGDQTTLTMISADTEFEFINSKEYFELPHTGGNGISMLLITGTLVMMCSAVLLVIRKKYSV